MSDSTTDITALQASRRSWHWAMLALATCAIVLTLLLRVRDDQKIELLVLPDLPLPEVCWSRQYLHQPCPGCGLTRSFIYLAHGRLNESLAVHRVGWLIFLALVVQFPYRWLSLQRSRDPVSPAFGTWFGVLLISALIGNWLFNLIQGT